MFGPKLASMTKMGYTLVPDRGFLKYYCKEIDWKNSMPGFEQWNDLIQMIVNLFIIADFVRRNPL